MARIYVAASYMRMVEAAELARRLVKAGHVVQSRWLSGPAPSLAPYVQPDEAMVKYAAEDLTDLFNCEALVTLTGDKPLQASRGGRHAELGMALAVGLRVIVLGPREQLFHWHPGVRVVATVKELLEVLS